MWDFVKKKFKNYIDTEDNCLYMFSADLSAFLWFMSEPFHYVLWPNYTLSCVHHDIEQGGYFTKLSCLFELRSCFFFFFHLELPSKVVLGHVCFFTWFVNWVGIKLNVTMSSVFFSHPVKRKRNFLFFTPWSQPWTLIDI